MNALLSGQTSEEKDVALLFVRRRRFRFSDEMWDHLNFASFDPHLYVKEFLSIAGRDPFRDLAKDIHQPDSRQDNGHDAADDTAIMPAGCNKRWEEIS